MMNLKQATKACRTRHKPTRLVSQERRVNVPDQLRSRRGRERTQKRGQRQRKNARKALIADDWSRTEDEFVLERRKEVIRCVVKGPPNDTITRHFSQSLSTSSSTANTSKIKAQFGLLLVEIRNSETGFGRGLFAKTELLPGYRIDILGTYVEEEPVDDNDRVFDLESACHVREDGVLCRYLVAEDDGVTPHGGYINASLNTGKSKNVNMVHNPNDRKYAILHTSLYK